MARRNGAEETVIGDLTEPASLTDAVAGMEGVFHIGPAHAAGEADMGLAMVDAMAMTGNELSYGTFELCAPGMLDSHQTAAIISEVLGRLITAVQIPLHQFASQLPEGPFRDGMRRMMAHYDGHGLPGGNPLVLRAILGREPRSLKHYFRELASR